MVGFVHSKGFLFPVQVSDSSYRIIYKMRWLGLENYSVKYLPIHNPEGTSLNNYTS